MHGERLALEPDEARAGRAEAGVAEIRTPSFEAVYARHFTFVWRSLRLLGVARDALPDAAQEVFGVVHRRLAEFERRAALGTWIFAIARRVAANHHRKHRHRGALEPLTGAEASEAPSPFDEVEATRAAETLVAFAGTLEEERRALFVLALIEGLPVPELVEPLGLPLNTLYSRIRALRRDLKEFLEGMEVER